jgi:hypothetical protein
MTIRSRTQGDLVLNVLVFCSVVVFIWGFYTLIGGAVDTSL